MTLALFLMILTCFQYFLFQLWTFTTLFFSSGSLFHLAAIAIDRYRAISQPLTYSKNRSPVKTILIIGMQFTSNGELGKRYNIY